MTKIDRGDEDFVGGKIVPLYGHSAHRPFLGRPFNVSARNPSSCFSHMTIWFQLAPVWATISKLLIPKS